MKNGKAIDFYLKNSRGAEGAAKVFLVKIDVFSIFHATETYVVSKFSKKGVLTDELLQLKVFTSAQI